MPVYVVLDAAGRVVGYCSAQHARDGTAHLLQLAGIDFAPEDRPASAAKILAAGGPRTPSELRAAGTEAPDFPMTDAAGQRVALADLRGKVIVLEFWATWCGPCLLAMPHAQELARTYREQGVVVIASCTRDEREKFEAWVAVHGADYPDVVFAHDPLAMGEDRAAKVHYGVDGIPVQFVLDREGRVIGSIKGYFPGEVLLDAMLARAGIAVDPKVLEKAAEDERLRGWRKGGTAAPADGSPQGVTPLGGGEVRVIRR
jgi:thiol-disulfide isomerase/thioredoxin